ncbi:MAG: hypothetical protein P8X57_07260 [Cyclobacteriaceae bacterium]
MNLIIRSILILILLLSGCNKLIECDNIVSREAVMIIDVTDQQLFNEIKADLSSNLPLFMKRTGLAEISPCEQFTLTLVPITSNEGLMSKSETIAITRKGQSYRTEQQQASPAPLVNLIRTELTSFSAMTEDADLTSGSNIANVILKALTHSTPGNGTTLIIFSDMIENNQYLNMYRHVPDSSEMVHVIETLIDPIVLKNFKARQAEGLETEVLIVFKENQLDKVKTSTRDIRSFWSALMGELGIQNVQFLDNLSNIN